MKRSYLMVVILAVFMVSMVQPASSALQAPAPDFRKASWGMTPQQVIASEGRQPQDRGPDGLLYADSVSSYRMMILYRFLDGSLAEASYHLAELRSNYNDYLGIYARLKDILTEKYGRPKSDLTDWSGDIFKDDRKSWGIAVATGYLSMAASWETARTTITEILYGNAYQVTLVMLYQSKAYKAALEKAAQAEAKSKF